MITMKRTLIIISLFWFGFQSFSQNKDSKWTLGFSGSLINFGNTGPNSVGDRFVAQVPKISFSRYLGSGFTFDFGGTISTVKKIEGLFGNRFDYYSLDGAFRYDFGSSSENLVPYVGIGMGWIAGPNTIANSNDTPTVNYIFGGTYWFAPRFGLNAEFTYKFSKEDYESMRSHTQISAGFVYSFKPRSLVQRLWHKRR